jgi:hypothetical protein
MNNSTIPAADHATHVKALAASAAILLINMTARAPAANTNAAIGAAGKAAAVNLAI